VRPTQERAAVTTQEYLSKIPIFQRLSSTDLDTLTGLCHQKTVPKDAILFRKGDFGTSMFAIEEGSLAITVPGGNGEKEIRVSVLHDGDFVGELSLINGSPRTATATIVRECKLLEINREDFLQFLTSRPMVAMSMLGELGKRLQATNDLITSISSKNINIEMDERMSFGDRLADRVADFVGSWAFLACYLAGIVAWCGVNVVQLVFAPLDPYPFVFLNLILALVASLQAPLIMMSQKRAQLKDRMKVDMDYQVNVKSELMLQQLHRKIDEVLARKP
jgi:CRP/FNR family transcriptional regulator, cyclic AMP receptor protein